MAVGQCLILFVRKLFPFHAAAWEAEAAPIRALLSAAEKDQKSLAVLWRESNQSQLTSVGITGALVASVVASGFTWPDLANPAWTVKAIFIASLVVALGSVATATHQAVALSRLAGNPYGHRMTYKLLEKRKNDDFEESTEPSLWQLYIWQIPVSLLSTSIYLFVAGLAVMVWDAGKAVQLKATEGPTKIIVAFMVTLAGVVFCYAASALSIYGRMRRATKEIEDELGQSATQSPVPQPGQAGAGGAVLPAGAGPCAHIDTAHDQQPGAVGS